MTKERNRIAKESIDMDTYFSNENKKKFAYCLIIPFSCNFSELNTNRKKEIREIENSFQINKLIIDREDYEKLLIKSAEKNI